MRILQIACIALVVAFILVSLIFVIPFQFQPQPPFNPPQHQIFVTNWGSQNVSVINASNYTVVKTIGGFSKPFAIAASPNLAEVFVTNSGSNTVSVINTTTDTIVRNITVGNNPSGVAFSTDGARAYVANYNNGGNSTVSVINTSTYAIISTINLGNLGGGAEGIAVSPTGNQIFVADYGSGVISIINASSNKMVTYIATYYLNPSGKWIGHRPYDIAFSPNGKYAFVSTSDAAAVYVINATTDTLAGNITNVGGGSDPWGSELAISPDGTKLFVANVSSVSSSPDGTVSVINTTSDAVIKVIGSIGGPYAITVSPNGSEIFITDWSTGGIYVFNSTTYAQIKHIPTGGNPSGIAIT